MVAGRRKCLPTLRLRTAVEFRLVLEGDATRVTTSKRVSSNLPAGRSSVALRGNTEGWNIQAENLREYAEARAEA